MSLVRFELAHICVNLDNVHAILWLLWNGKQKMGWIFFSGILFGHFETSRGSALRSFICAYQLFPRNVCWKIVTAHFRWLYYVNFGRTLNFHSGSWVRIPAGNFQKFALIPRISNYVYIQALGHKKQCCEGLCKSIWSFI